MSSPLEALLRRDRTIVFAALAVITALAWADIISLADDMAGSALIWRVAV